VCGGGSIFELGTPEGLAALKLQLRQALAQVEAQEEELAERMAPQTVEDAEALENQLKEALAELAERKKTLRKRQAEGEKD
jgi:tRNA1(Val) A37 N6-methylase TrmN6